MKWKLKVKLAGIVAGVLLGLSGCGHGPGMETGTSSFRVVERPFGPPPNPVATNVEPVSRANFHEAQVIHPLVMPAYPRRALKARAGAATVGVRVTVDPSGAVVDIRPSMLATSVTPSKFAEDFREAVEVAVRQWKFHPARVEQIETVTAEGTTYQRWASSENVEAEFDLAFTFTPSGRVVTVE